ncbi:alpha,alpha-trehalase TreF [Poritiphilus flavus]|uniref:Alpha,alpha-trehalase TreF n=1 Tax=Poritiphilus flavus TaxID=2697053 RepID=A0A6L9E6Y1_9FLAO|nr:alpha,alpha-trehalase TreF [Poritiphilus flavus]NAS10507.1 alpha,alpha-trehalase TreF [Poritiphilus flavus]
MRYVSLLIFLLLFSCRTEVDQKKNASNPSAETTISREQELQTPDVLLGALFAEVQLNQVFEDGKTFVDCTAKFPYELIRANYQKDKDSPDFDLETFVLEHFEVPQSISSDFKSDPNRTAAEHVEALWPVLERQSDQLASGSTLIALPNPYIVPGGRFREVYYWDSYFTMLGLVESKRFDLVEAMLDNFAHLINTVGHIPNGNRTYYITRSQPPFFSQMVKLLAEQKGGEIYSKYRDALRKEYDFWMQGSHATEQPIKHCVSTPKGIMNRYFDLGETPRQESYREDFTQVQEMGGGIKMYQDLRAGAESGWDYSTRWFADGHSLETIETTDILPVDLNALLYGLEAFLQECFKEDAAYVAALGNSMANRKEFLDTYCWDTQQGIYLDYNWVTQKRSPVRSLAMVYPLFFGMASQDQADAVAASLEKDFLKPGGVVTTLRNSGQQWDAPNGWAPLQWMTVIGLERYGHSALARDIAERWVTLNERVYKNTGKFVEKYNVEDMSLEAGGGEYPVQDGFGWSNGVYLALKAYLDRS